MSQNTFIESLKRLRHIEIESHQVESQLLQLAHSLSVQQEQDQSSSVFPADFTLMVQTTIESLIPMRQMIAQMMRKQLETLDLPQSTLSALTLSSLPMPPTVLPPPIEAEDSLSGLGIESISEADHLSDEEIKALGLGDASIQANDLDQEIGLQPELNKEDVELSFEDDSFRSSSRSSEFALDETPIHQYSVDAQQRDVDAPSQHQNPDEMHTQIGLPYQPEDIESAAYSDSSFPNSRRHSEQVEIKPDFSLRHPHDSALPFESTPVSVHPEWSPDLFPTSAGEAGTMFGVDVNNPLFHRPPIESSPAPASEESIAPPIPPLDLMDDSAAVENLWEDLSLPQSEEDVLHLTSTPHPLDPIKPVAKKKVHVNRETRVACSTPILIETPYLKEKGQCENLNTGGLFIKIDAQFQVGEEVRLYFSLPEMHSISNPLSSSEIVCTALVRWKNEKGIGVNFLDLRRTDKHKIQGYLSLSSH